MDHTTDLAVLAARGPVDGAAPGAALDVPTIKALTEFASALERTARASRPIVLHGPAAPAPYAAPGPEPIDVRIPPAPEPTAPARPEPSNRRLFTRAELNIYAGMSAMGTAGLSAVIADTWRPLPIAAAAAVWVLISALVVFVQDGPGRGQGRTS
jgi:hypothetical protein